MTNFKDIVKISLLGTLFAVGIGYVAAWISPTATPPAGNTPAPLNVSAEGQTKAGGLILGTGNPLNGLVVQGGNLIVQSGSSAIQNGNLIVQNGKVGIGVASPDVNTRLDVSGGIRFRDLASNNSNTRIVTVDGNNNLAYRAAGSWTCPGCGGGVGGLSFFNDPNVASSIFGYSLADQGGIIFNQVAVAPNFIAGIALRPTYKLPQGCASDQIPKWNGSVWVCANAPPPPPPQPTVVVPTVVPCEAQTAFGAGQLSVSQTVSCPAGKTLVYYAETGGTYRNASVDQTCNVNITVSGNSMTCTAATSNVSTGSCGIRGAGFCL